MARELQATESRLVPVPIAEVLKCRIETPKDAAAVKALETELQPGEAEAIVLAREHQAELLIDERMGRLVARRLGIGHTGVIGLLDAPNRSSLFPLCCRSSCGRVTK